MEVAEEEAVEMVEEEAAQNFEEEVVVAENVEEGVVVAENVEEEVAVVAENVEEVAVVVENVEEEVVVAVAEMIAEDEGAEEKAGAEKQMKSKVRGRMITPKQLLRVSAVEEERQQE